MYAYNVEAHYLLSAAEQERDKRIARRLRQAGLYRQFLENQRDFYLNHKEEMGLGNQELEELREAWDNDIDKQILDELRSPSLSDWTPEIPSEAI